MHADIFDCEDLLARAEVVIMNNVFEFFHDRSRRRALWERMRQMLHKPGLRLVTVPSVHESLARCGAQIDCEAWLGEVPLTYPFPAQTSVGEASVETSAFISEVLSEKREEFEQIHLYTVK